MMPKEVQSLLSTFLLDDKTLGTDFCSAGLELRCSDERQKMKFVAIKSILEAQRLLVAGGHKPETAYFSNTIAQVSSILTSSAKYLAMLDATISDSPIYIPLLSMQSDDSFSYDDMHRFEKDSVQSANLSKRRRIR